MNRGLLVLFALAVGCHRTVPAVDASRVINGKSDSQHFKIDPIVDGSLIAMGIGFSALEEVITSTGEIVPQRPGPQTDVSLFDRGAITQTVDPSAATLSNIGLATAIGFAVIDPVVTGFRDGWDAALVDFVMYGETLSLTLAVTDIAKVAVRRPRPLAYREQAALDAQYPPGMSPSITDTDSQLSFFSGHAAICASVTATATYLAFRRAGPKSVRPWITLGVGTALTTFVSIERVRAGVHFPTDVIAGTFVGVAIGILVPHLHRHASELPRVWIGGAPMPGGGGGTISGLF
jgi:undecaprenyl-diphosphatase